MPTAIVLDKSFLQGSKAAEINQLAESHRLIVSDALFYELLTTDEPGRSRCFAKFPQSTNPVELVSHIGVMMRIEIDSHLPSGKPSQHREVLQFRFNPGLSASEYVFSPEALAVINSQTEMLRTDVASYLERVELMPKFFPDLLVGADDERRIARDEAEKAISEPRWLMPLYAQLQAPAGERPLPPASVISEDWAIYRWLQIQFLFALDVNLRYKGELPDTCNSRIYERMEHDLLDIQVLGLGCLEGSFATRETKLKRWWKLLCPTGTLYE